jgi:chromate transporter
MSEPTPGGLAATFGLISLIAIGGANAVVPDIHRQVVEVHGWMDSAAFAQLFAIAQVAPGPNVLIVSLIGWKLAGWGGLAVATLAMLAPSSLIAFAAGRGLAARADAPWVKAAKTGLAPIAVGLIAASGLVMARAADSSFWLAGATAGAAAFVVFTRANPLTALAVAAVAAVVATRSGLTL